MSSLESRSSKCTKIARKYVHKATKSIMRSYHVRIPVYDMPIRLRPWFLFFTIIVMLLLAFLGFTNFSHSLPLNDKFLHFVCLMLATSLFYFIFDIEEDARRIWFWRDAPLICTGIVCFLFGGIMSEFVQSMLPHKEFQFGDIVANLLGSSVGVYVAYHLERYYRHRREISRLYRPLENDYLSSDEEDFESGVQLLPTHHSPRTAGVRSKSAAKPSRLADVWDEREDLFDIGEESEEEDDRSRPGPAPSSPVVPSPKIVVTR